MKEFEKLWENNHPTYDMGSDTVGHYNIAEEYWKAALEMVLDMKKEDVYGGDVYNKAYHIPDWAVDIIEKELKEE